jgi:predicted nucleic acid-binding protein
MERLFLDANILFSAAYREGAGIRQFWELSSVKLLTSQYAFEEAKRNLNQTQGSRLARLIKHVKVYAEYGNEAYIPKNILLRKKDRPILAAAIGSEANYLITGDFRDFGCLYGQRILGVMILAPSIYLKSHYKEVVQQLI